MEVKNISPIGIKLINIKNNNFLSFKDTLNLNFFIKKNDIKKNGINEEKKNLNVNKHYYLQKFTFIFV